MAIAHILVGLGYGRYVLATREMVAQQFELVLRVVGLFPFGFSFLFALEYFFLYSKIKIFCFFVSEKSFRRALVDLLLFLAFNCDIIKQKLLFECKKFT